MNEQRSKFVFLGAVVMLAASFVLNSIFVNEILESHSWLGMKLNSIPETAWIFRLSLIAGTVISGACAVRWPTPWLVMAGGLVVLGGYPLLMLVDSPFMIGGAVVVLGAGLGACGFPLILSMVSVWTPARQRLTSMMAVLAVALAVEGFLWPSPRIVGILLDGYAGPVIALLVLCLVLATYGVRKTFSTAVASDPVARPSIVAAFSDTFTNKSFWILSFSMFVVGFHAEYVTSFLESAKTTASPTSGVKVSMFVNAISFLGLIAAGWFGHLVPVKRSVAVLHLLCAIVMIIFVFVPLPVPPSILLVTVVGMAWLSTALLIGYAVADIFGTRYLGLLFGLFYLAHEFGKFSSEFLSEISIALTGDAYPAWLFTIAIGFTATFLQKNMVERRPDSVQSTIRINRILNRNYK